MEYSPTKPTHVGGIGTMFYHHQRHTNSDRFAQSVCDRNSDSNDITDASNMQVNRSPSSSQNQHHHNQRQHRDDYQRQRQQQLQFQQQLEQLIYNSPMQCKTETQQQFMACVFSPSVSSSSPSSASVLSHSSFVPPSPASTGSSSPLYLNPLVHAVPGTVYSAGDNMHTGVNKRQSAMKDSELASPSLQSPAQVAFQPSPIQATTSTCKRRLDFNHNDDASNLNFRIAGLNQNINQTSSQSPVFNQNSSQTTGFNQHHFSQLQLTSPHQHDINQNLHDAAQLHQDGSQHYQDVHSLVHTATGTVAMHEGVNMNEVSQSRDLSQDIAALGRVPAVAVARRNERERNRVKLINMTFATLREHLPQSLQKGCSSKNKKMSKVETLRAAIDYIRELHAVIKDRQASGTLPQHHSSNEDFENIHRGAELETVLGVEKLEVVNVASDRLIAAKASSSARQASSQVSPLSSAGGGGQSPLSDDCGSSYDQLSAEEEDLLDFASWF